MMVLDTSSKEAMEMSVATFLDISTDELCQYIEYAAEKAMDAKLVSGFRKSFCLCILILSLD